jgi:hypothetical protein
MWVAAPQHVNVCPPGPHDKGAMSRFEFCITAIMLAEAENSSRRLAIDDDEVGEGSCAATIAGVLGSRHSH